jgi:hypothetical protein
VEVDFSCQWVAAGVFQTNQGTVDHPRKYSLGMGVTQANGVKMASKKLQDTEMR